MVVDSDGLVRHWSGGAEALFGYAATDVTARPVTEVLAIPWDEHGTPAEQRFGTGWAGSLTVRHRDGHRLEIRAQICPLGPDRTAGWLVVATDPAVSQALEREHAILSALFTQSPIGLAVVDPQLRLAMVNPALERMDGVPARLRLGRALRDTVPEGAGPMAEARAREVLETGEPQVVVSHVDPRDAAAHVPHVCSRSSFRLQDPAGHSVGLGQAVLDVTSYYRARRHLALINEAGVRIGSTLDLDRTVQELADVLVPRVADFVAVDLSSRRHPRPGGRPGAHGRIRRTAPARRAVHPGLGNPLHEGRQDHLGRTAPARKGSRRRGVAVPRTRPWRQCRAHAA